MLTQKQIKEIKEHLDKAQNPLFFFDNDTDGLCSFLLLQRYIGRGKGVPVKSFPDLSGDYFRKVEELNADYIFILDKPIVSKEFFEKAEQINIPTVYIDHHNIDKEGIPEFVDYYNPLFNENKSNEPVSALCYQINDRKNDLWIAVVGCISDRFIPDFYYNFRENYPNLAGSDSKEPKEPFDILYNSRIGKIAMILNFALKDRTTNVINMLKFLTKVNTPYEILEENSKNHSMHLRFKQVNSKYQKLLKNAISKISDEKFLFFQFGGDLSIAGELSNELSYKFPNKIIVVVYVKGAKANISIRGKKIRNKVLEVLTGFEDATGGGHEDAVGAKIRVKDVREFRRRLEDLVFRAR